MTLLKFLDCTQYLRFVVEKIFPMPGGSELLLLKPHFTHRRGLQHSSLPLSRLLCVVPSAADVHCKARRSWQLHQVLQVELALPI